MYTVRFGKPSVCLWIYGAGLSLLPLDECSICCTDRQLSKENGMGPLRPFCHKSCHPDQLCLKRGNGGKWAGDRRNSHVTASQEDSFSTDESKVPVLHIWNKIEEKKTCTVEYKIRPFNHSNKKKMLLLHKVDVFISTDRSQRQSKRMAS